MKTYPLKTTLTIAALILGINPVQSLYANDISHNVRSGQIQSNTPENYFEIGYLRGIGDGPARAPRTDLAQFVHTDNGHYDDSGLLINGFYQWNNIFLEAYSESGHGLVIGYNAMNTEDWSLDFITTTSLGRFKFDSDGRGAGFNYTTPDDSLTVGARLTGFIDNNVLQFSLNQDATGDHDGTTVTATLGRSFQWRNWNFHGLVGAEYATSRVNDYYLGVDEESVSPIYTLYDAGASLNFSAEAGVTYPLTEDIVFRMTARAVKLDDAITDSPYFSNGRTSAISMRTSISYVF